MTTADPTASSLSIRLFGPLEVRVNGDLPPHLRTHKGEWLFALLTLRAGGHVERAWLAGTLWPASGERQAMASLRRCLTDLRRALGQAASRLGSPTPQTLCLDLEGAAVDVHAFDAAVGQNDEVALERAVAFYRGPLLEGCAEAWAFQERQVREQAYLQALEQLAARALGRGDTAAAERRLRQVVAVDPLRESAQRTLMQTLAAGGNYAAALLTYRELGVKLHRELSAAPDPETTALFQSLRERSKLIGKGGSRLLGHGSRPPQGSRTLEPLTVNARRAGERRHNLPLQLTSFIGREPQMAEVKRFLANHRLVTLVGAGGCGKTRLALQVVSEQVESFAGGAWLVDLAPLAEASLVPQSVARALDVREEPGRTLIATLTDALREKELLLLLNNCEHLVGACAQLAGALLQHCPHLRVLATSREPLGVPGERRFRVPSLSLPDAAQPLSGKQLWHSEATRLFIERAVAVLPTFTVTSEVMPAVAAVCRRLDGIPLAIELAAARVRALPVTKLAERLDDRFCLLTGGSPTALPRHQTLRALIDWSYDLLSEPERTLLRHLSVFVGGWTLEAAEGICADDNSRPPTGDGRRQWIHRGRLSVVGDQEVLDLLTSLVDKNLVLYEEWEEEGRYRLLETARQYSGDRLREAGEAERTRGWHRDWFLALAERADLGGHNDAEWLARLERDHDNLRAALDRCVEQGEAEVGLRLGGALWEFWHARGYLAEGRERLAKLLALPGGEARSGARAWALHGAGALAQEQGDYAAARRIFEESLAIQRELGNRMGIAISLNNLGRVAYEHGDYAAARKLLAESLAIKRELGDKSAIAVALNNLGNVAHGQGDYTAAQERCEESLAIRRELGNRSGIAYSLNNLGNVAHGRGDYAAARRLHEESLAIKHEVGDPVGIAESLEALAALAVVEGRPERVARLVGAAAALREALQAPLPPRDQERIERDVTAARRTLGDEVFTAAWAAGRAMPLEAAISYALKPAHPGD